MPELNSIEYDFLKELASVGGKKASLALSQLINHQVKIEIPSLKIALVKDIPSLMGRKEQVVTMVLVKIVGDVAGTMLFIFEPQDAPKLAALLNNRSQLSSILDEVDKSALKEVGNILAGAVLNTLSSFLTLTLLQSIPEITTDMIVTVMDNVISQFGDHSKEVLVVNLTLSVGEKGGIIKMYFLFDPSSTESIISATKQKLS